MVERTATWVDQESSLWKRDKQELGQFYLVPHVRDLLPPTRKPVDTLVEVRSV